MQRSVHYIGLMPVLCLLVVPLATGQLRSPDPFQREAAPQRQEQDQQGVGQSRGPSQGDRAGQDGRQGQGGQRRPDDIRRLQGGGQRGGQSEQQGGGQRGPGGQGGGSRGGQGGGGSRNPVILALDVNRDGELSASEIANAATALKALDKNGDGNLSRDEMRPADADSNRGPGGDQRGRPAQGSSRPPAGQLRPPQSNTRLPMSNQAVSRIDAVMPTRATPAPADGFALIPAGQFEMGDHHELGGQEHRNDEVPIHSVSINAFQMQRTETTKGQFCEFLNDAWTAKTIEVRDGQVVQAGANIVYCDTYASDEAAQIALDSKERFVVRPGKERHPVVCIRWHGAAGSRRQYVSRAS